VPRPDDAREFPYWLVAILGLLALIAAAILADAAVYRPLFLVIVRGLWITAWVTVVSFGFAALLGLGLALMGRAQSLAVRQAARFYVELVRGVPVLILLLYVGFVAVPALVELWNRAFAAEVRVRDVPLAWRAVLALALCYAAFLAEEFRAGIEAVPAGQGEAAAALGLSRWGSFRLVVLPQAIPVALPPVGNSFINMIKDSALVSVLGVADVTFEGRAAAARSFRFFEAFNIVAFLYLTLTIGLALLLRRVERRFRSRER
jgi:polar amino acid transport system permease protein